MTVALLAIAAAVLIGRPCDLPTSAAGDSGSYKISATVIDRRYKRNLRPILRAAIETVDECDNPMRKVADVGQDIGAKTGE